MMVDEEFKERMARHVEASIEDVEEMSGIAYVAIGENCATGFVSRDDGGTDSGKIVAGCQALLEHMLNAVEAGAEFRGRVAGKIMNPPVDAIEDVFEAPE